MQAAGFEHGHAIADGQRLLRVVGHDQAAGTAAGQHPGQFGTQPQPYLHIEVGEGFIQEHQRAARRQGAGEGQALALATGELVGVAALEPLQAQQLQQPGGATAVLAVAQPEGGVAPGIEVGEKGVVLKHHAHAAALGGQPAVGPGHLLAADPHHPSLRPLEAGDQAQQGGLAAAGGAQQAHQFAWAQLEIDGAQGPVATGGWAAVAMPQARELHLGPQRQLGGGQLGSHQAGSP